MTSFVPSQTKGHVKKRKGDHDMQKELKRTCAEVVEPDTDIAGTPQLQPAVVEILQELLADEVQQHPSPFGAAQCDLADDLLLRHHSLCDVLAATPMPSIFDCEGGDDNLLFSDDGDETIVAAKLEPYGKDPNLERYKDAKLHRTMSWAQEQINASWRVF